jgi:hypothetical protein
MVALTVILPLFSGCVDEDRDAAYRAQVQQDYSDRSASLAGYRQAQDQNSAASTPNSR